MGVQEMWANWKELVTELAREPNSPDMAIAKLLEMEGQLLATASDANTEDDLHEEEDVMIKFGEWGVLEETDDITGAALDPQKVVRGPEKELEDSRSVRYNRLCPGPRP